jgi:4,4'-diaponeurosporenoate glycosyltransferase
MSVLLVLVQWAVGWGLLLRIPRLGPPGDVPPAAAPSRRLIVVIPARDEESNLPALLRSIAAQTRRPDRCVVADDASTDLTPVVAARHGADVVAVPPVPEGWAGKPWACSAGVKASGALEGDDLLVFLDADVRLEPHALAALEAAAGGGLLSVQPHHHVERPHEQLSAFFDTVATMGVGHAAARPSGEPAGAYGPCLVTSVAGYRRVGGHETVAGEVLDDVHLARRYRDAGLPVRVLGGRGTVVFRMYPAGTRQLIEGRTKNIAAGAGSTPPLRLVLIVLWLGGAIATAWSLPTAILAGGAVGAWGLLYLAYASQLAVQLRQLGTYRWWVAAFFPVPLVVFLGVFVRSVVAVLRGTARWRGRDVALR